MKLRTRIAHFLAIGALLFVADRLVGERYRPTDTATVQELPVVSPATLARLRAGWLRDTGRNPTESEWRRLVDAEVDDELLLREARRRGFHLSDALVRRRLARNVEFASTRPADGVGRVTEALELGLDKTDLVVRRRLIQKMKLLAFDTETPADEELSQYLAANSDRFERGERIDLEHIFFDSDRRGNAEFDASASLAELDPTDPQRPANVGDAFIHGAHTGLVSREGLAQRFGEAFAESVFGAEIAGWTGPIRSSFGSHLVWVHERRAPRIPPLEVVRAEVAEALLAERRRASLKKLLDGLRSETTARVEHRQLR